MHLDALLKPKSIHVYFRNYLSTRPVDEISPPQPPRPEAALSTGGGSSLPFCFFLGFFSFAGGGGVAGRVGDFGLAFFLASLRTDCSWPNSSSSAKPCQK